MSHEPSIIDNHRSVIGFVDDVTLMYAIGLVCYFPSFQNTNFQCFKIPKFQSFNILMFVFQLVLIDTLIERLLDGLHHNGEIDPLGPPQDPSTAVHTPPACDSASSSSSSSSEAGAATRAINPEPSRSSSPGVTGPINHRTPNCCKDEPFTQKACNISGDEFVLCTGSVRQGMVNAAPSLRVLNIDLGRDQAKHRAQISRGFRPPSLPNLSRRVALHTREAAAAQTLAACELASWEPASAPARRQHGSWQRRGCLRRQRGQWRHGGWQWHGGWRQHGRCWWMVSWRLAIWISAALATQQLAAALATWWVAATQQLAAALATLWSTMATAWATAVAIALAIALAWWWWWWRMGFLWSLAWWWWWWWWWWRSWRMGSLGARMTIGMVIGIGYGGSHFCIKWVLEW